MRTHTIIADARAAADEARAAGAAVGFVPTMGFLHEGHMSLVRRALAENDFAIVSIFVNPTQFAPGEDYEAYPRDIERDATLLEAAGVDALFAPTADEMYPAGATTTVDVGEIGDIMCGASRPSHFRGVATIVTKLLSIVGPSGAYFGEKDYQQLVVIRRVVRDLDLPVVVVGCPTVREPDGLAIASRNVYLTQAERAVAPSLRVALGEAQRLVELGEKDPGRVRDAVLAALAPEPLWRADYVEVRDAETLGSVSVVERPVVVAAAAHLGRARLIDNVVASPPA